MQEKNRFEEYNSSQIVSQHTLLKKFNKIIEYLKENTNFYAFYSKDRYLSDEFWYYYSNMELNGKKVNVGDLIFFENGFIGFVDENTKFECHITNAISIKGIGTAYDLYAILKGSDTIVVDLTEDEKKVEVHLDHDIITKIQRALQLPVSINERKIVAVDENGNQEMLGIGEGLTVEVGKLKSTGGSSSSALYIHNLKFAVYGSFETGCEIRFQSTRNNPLTIQELQNGINLPSVLLINKESYISNYIIVNHLKLEKNQSDEWSVIFTGFQMKDEGPFYYYQATETAYLGESSTGTDLVTDTILTL